MDLTNGSFHRLVELFERRPEEAISTEHLRLLLNLGLGSLVERCLELGHAEEHVLLGLVLGVNAGAFVALDALDDSLGHFLVEAESTTKDVLAVEG